MVFGASPILEEVLVKSLEVFKQCKFWQAYGLTETTGGGSTAARGSRPDRPNRHRLRSCGEPGPGVELRIVGTTR